MNTTTTKTTKPQTFEEWMKATDAACIRRTGLSIHDLCDQCYADWFEDGMTPAEAARSAIRAETGDDY